jgi:ribose transport system substrate-binding protein
MRSGTIVSSVLLASLASGAFPQAGYAADGAKIGYSAGFLTDPFQAVLVADTLKKAEAEHLSPLPAANANGDAAKQISDVHNLISTGAQALIVNPTDSQAIAPALAFAAEKKVPVVTIDIAPARGSFSVPHG